MIKKFNENIKKLDMWDMACTKLAMAFGIMFLFSVWPGLRNFIQSVNPWMLFFGWIIFALRPLSRFFSKK
jgi:hypothetical protein